MKLIALSLLILASLAAAADEPRTLDYTWLTIGEPTGAQSVVYDGENGSVITWNFNDRGRGPETRTRVRTNDAGLPLSIEVTGKNYRKGEVDETFLVAGGNASWKSNVESGHADFANDAFYVPNNAAPEIIAMLARAILQSENSSVKLLPTGQATIHKLTDVTLQDENGTHDITLYGINGLDSSPTHVWLDSNDQFFGIDYGWFGITQKGFEQHIDTLKTAQAAATDDYFESASAELTTPIEGSLAIRGARIFDSINGELTDPATVFIWQGKISAVYFEDVDIPADTTVIEAEGQTLLPTLWDMHGHVSVESYFNYLAAGVTNVRDMANDEHAISKLSGDVRSGRIAGPDIYALGFIDKRGEFSAPTGRLADTIDDARSFIDFYAQNGFHGIKLYSSIEPQWVAPLASYAHDLDLVVKGHVPAYMNAEQAINAGYDEITHINMILLNFLGAENLDTRTPTRFKVPGEQAGDIDLDSSQVAEFIALMKEKNVAHDPTLSIFMDMFLNEPGKVSPIFREIADHLPANARRQSIAGSGYNAGQEAIYARSAEKTLQMIRLLHDSGIRLLPGTDNALPGFSLIRELQYYTQAGIPASEALQLATIVSARHLSQDQRLGSITAGKDAQLYLVEGNPLENMSDLYKVRHVIQGERMYFAPDILTAQGFTPF